VKLARVIGTVVATTKCAGLGGVKLLVVQPLDRDGNDLGSPAVAADGTAQAGPGHLVFIVGSREAAQAMPERFVPVDLAITGIVDDVHRSAGDRAPTAVWRDAGAGD
jgi:ethanolamine utilization protein EutN